MPTRTFRRSDYDVTDTVQVSSSAAVCAAVEVLFSSTWDARAFEPVAQAFTRIDDLFAGRVPGYHGVDTVYHDTQHTLDITLAAARLMVGYEQQVPEAEKLGAERAAVGLIIALFHDIGYLRRQGEDDDRNGAEFTRNHVSRGAEHLKRFLPEVGLEAWVPMATQVIHFTGYEVPFAKIDAPDPRDRKLGALIGTGDMIAQMADRCYLEKCRDRLYPEFVLGGMALPIASNGGRTVKYASGLDLLRQTPEFMTETRAKRLDGDFDRAYRYLDVLFGGRNPYMEAIERNAEFLHQILRSESWQMLRRQPPLFVAHPDPLNNVRGAMLSYIRKAWSR